MNKKIHNRPSISTGTGDKGITSLFGGGRVPKYHPQMVATGDCDELNAAIGLAKAACSDPERWAIYETIQRDLIVLMGNVALNRERTPRESQSKGHLDETRILWIESHGIELEKHLPPLKDWDLPGANAESAALHLARVICRRAERSLLAIPEDHQPPAVCVLYLNRLSDWFWLAARTAAESADPMESRQS